MNKEFIERIENEVNSINIIEKDPFVIESCKNLYRALLVVLENENPKISDISSLLSDADKTIELLKKFDGINKEKYNGDLSYIFVDTSNTKVLVYLISLLDFSMSFTDDSNDTMTNNEIEQPSNNSDLTIKKTSHKLINVKTYDNHDEFTNNIKNMEENSVFDIGSWWGEGGYGMQEVIIMNDKNLYKGFCEEAIKPTRYELEMYEPLSDEEFDNLIGIINNNLLNVPEEKNMVFDGGDYITINCNGTKKSFENMIDRDKYQMIKNAIHELFEESENPSDDKSTYMSDGDENNEIQANNNVSTSAQEPWEEYLEINAETGEKKLKANVPDEILAQYLKSENYIIISSTGYFSKEKFKACFISLKEDKIYNYTYDFNGNDKLEFYKDLTNNQKTKLIDYIESNDLLNVSIDILVFDASDNIEISMNGKTNIIKNASKEFTRNEMHIFDDIVNIVFYENTPLDKIKSFFKTSMTNDATD